MQYMISQGVNPNLIAQGFGESNPVASNKTPEGRAKNRRVELNLAGAGE
jgi:outer membrane protein OmpA-like peptidoglycan-associated protein